MRVFIMKSQEHYMTTCNIYLETLIIKADDEIL